MRKVIDQSNDAGFAVLRTIVERYPALKEFSKSANLDPSEFEKLSSDSFAWPGERKFPIHTPQHTAISIGYSKVAQKLPKDVHTILKKAAALHSVDSEVFTEASIEKIASVPEEYLLQEKRRFRVTCAGDIPRVEDAYRTKYAQLSVEDRAEAGMRLVKLAERYEVPLSSSTQKLAGFTMTSTRVFKDWMNAREEAARRQQSPLASAFTKLANSYTNTEPFIENRDDQIKLARLVHDLDEKAGLTGYYGHKLPTPIETVFNTDLLRKDFVKISSALMNKAVLQNLPLSFWEDTLGSDIAKEIAPEGEVDIETLEQILPTLPADLKSALETQLTAYNS